MIKPEIAKENLQLPSVSVIVPMYNEEKYIKTCLSSLFRQDYPNHLYEIIVLDGLSTDNSAHMVKKLINTGINNTKLIIVL